MVGSIPTANSSQEAEIGSSPLTITYPDYYKGNFDTDKIEVRIKKKKCRSKK